MRLAGHKFLLNLSRLYLLHAERQVPGLSVRFHVVDSPMGIGSDGTGRGRIGIRSEDPAGEEWVLYPDAVIAVTDCGDRKTLLFFLEVDMGTEPVVRKRQTGADIAGKIQRYQDYFRSCSYKEYEAILKTNLNGFRVLFLANTAVRQSELCRAIRAMPPSQFIWTASFDDMRVRGMSGAIWVKGGKPEDGPHSILGRYSHDAPLPEKVV